MLHASGMEQVGTCAPGLPERWHGRGGGRGWTAAPVGFAVAGVLVLGPLLFGCSRDGRPQQAPAGPTRPITVLAAASLADVLPNIGEAWERAGGSVRFGFDATSRLAPQIAQGAPADVFVSADRAWMDWVEARGLIEPSSRREPLRNRLVLVVPAQSPDTSSSLPELLTRVPRLALAGENVPAGRYARAALEAEELWAAVEARVVRGGSVRGALEWVARGDAEAGIVYRTDALAEPEVRVVDSLTTASAEVTYSVAVLSRSSMKAEAEDFLRFLDEDLAGEILREAGFGVTGPERQSRADTSAALPQGDSSPARVGIAWAVRLSLLVAVASALLGLAPAVSLGWLLARHEFRGKSLATTLILVPLVIPPVVTGFLLLSAFGEQGLGPGLALIGIRVPFSLLGAIIAAFVVGFPLYVMAIRGAFEAVDHRLEEVSWSLGVPPKQTFRRISLPLALPGIAAGAVLAFARALGEFGATVVLAGNMEGRTRTIALAVYTLLESPGGQDAIWVLVGASLLLSALALLGYEVLSRRQQTRLERSRA